MNTTIKTETEPIFARLDEHRNALAHHPLLAAAAAGSLPEEVLHEFAFHQYVDSILWVPMLSQMKAKALRSRRLGQAIADNIACETGLDGASHVSLAVTLMRSLGITSVEHLPSRVFMEAASEWLSEGFASFTEPAVAGWLLGAEALVPLLFSGMQPCFERLAGCDTSYFGEHVAVDESEHAAWMAEAVSDVVAVYGVASLAEVVCGLDAAYAEAIEVPDALWARHACRGRSQGAG